MLSLFASLGVMSIALKPKPSLGAERISFYLPVFGEFQLSVDSLEIFAKEGKVTKEFDFYAKRFDRETLDRLRGLLQQQYEISPTIIYRLTNTPLGERFLRQLGEVVYTHPERNGIYAIRAAMILAASDPKGLTAINLMRQFPTEEIQIDSKLIFSLVKEANNYLAYNESTVKAIAQIAEEEITSQSQVDFDRLPDVRQPGDYGVERKAISFEVDRLRQTEIGLSDSFELDTDVYLPQGQTKPAPLVVITHGFTSSRGDFQYLAEHLASHGYIVLVPEHIGSDAIYKEAFLRGELSTTVSPIEFYSRPQDITTLLDEVEESELNSLINWQQVGIFGHSFGGNTALVVAGAPINQARINQECQENELSLNASMLLQCRASFLPPIDFDQRDSRIKAVIAINPVTSTALGPESMGKIEIPTMMLGGSKDIAAPFVIEQAHPFLWLKTKHKYLGVMAGGTHGYEDNKGKNNSPSGLFANPLPELRRSYLKAMSLAFFESYLGNSQSERTNYQAYLSNAYAQYISDRKLPLHLIESLTPEQLELAYGDTPPIPPIPEAISLTASLRNAISPETEENVLAQIRKTKTLKVAMRSDTAPFSYVDDRENEWTGYCGDLADSFGEYLEQRLNIAAGIKVIKLSSSLENRFELVRDNTVHLECGPNTITPDKQDIVFSNPFLISGTRFLVAKNNAAKVDRELTGIRVGVLYGSTNADFLQENYPQAEAVYFRGKEGRVDAIEATVDGNIDAFISDGVLLQGEIEQQNLPLKNYLLTPEQPLTCNFYGLILPEGQSKWKSLVNDFIAQKNREIQNRWLRDYSAQTLSDADYCLNRLTE
ncbi:alpha/beta fold hydrolase [Pleurocapsa sp. CCALA 161]|uniref:alpha/beta fold hydrolase n=1 Tax=Pleurocapsa sp. CCALA 161 TaxID=2107688 RepID=UPI001E39F632|nr:alpha/beta fold hydrolase [Pleurocapsa sp. CCALA 161]